MSNNTNKPNNEGLFSYWYLFVVLVLICSIGTISAQSADAQTMSNNNYILQFGEFNQISGVLRNQQHAVTLDVGENSSQPLQSTSFTAAKDENNKKEATFSFQIEDMLIDFGSLTPTNPVSRNTAITISNPFHTGYTIQTFQNNTLSTAEIGDSIPNTSCDNGSCTQGVGSAWTSTLVYGFGYRCDTEIKNVCFGFENLQSFKRFPTVKNSEKTEIMAQLLSPQKDTELQITYKVNISKTQKSGSYRNNITLLAIPNY